MTDISIIIVNWNTKQLLLDCLTSIYSTIRSVSFEVIVSDNGSRDGSCEAVAAAFPSVRLIENGRNLGFARANNAALGTMTGRYALLLNSDTVLLENAVDHLIAFMESHPGAGMCGPQLLYGDGSLQQSIGDFPQILTDFTSRTVFRLYSCLRLEAVKPVPHVALRESTSIVDYIMGSCMLARKSAIDEVGMLDEDYFFFYEEIDWCFRMHQAGWKVYHVPETRIIHLSEQSRKHINIRARIETWNSRYLFHIKSYRLSRPAVLGLYLLGFFSVSLHLMEYTALNAAVLFVPARLRNRFLLFWRLFLWHLRGFPVSMGLPRS